jgi:predicted porin
MKKSLIALAALSAFATAAQAQSSVSVYGIFDLGYQDFDYTNIGASTASSAQKKAAGLNQAGSTAGALSSNRIGFRGTEDLGGGLKAGFNYELGFTPAASTNDTATNNGTLTTTPRESKVSLESAKYGKVELGYGLTGLHSTVAGHRANGGTNFVGDLSYYSDTTATKADSRIHTNSVRASGVSYYSPAIMGVTARIDAGRTSDVDGDKTQVNARNMGVTLNYTTGPLALAATKHDYYTQAAEDGAATAYEYNAISAKYALTSAITLDALYAKREASNGSTQVQSAKDDVTQVGVKYTVGNTAFTAMYGNGNGESTAGADKVDRKGYQLGVLNSLSKRTTAYAMYGNQEGKVVSSGVAEKVSAFAVGVRHSF